MHRPLLAALLAGLLIALQACARADECDRCRKDDDCRQGFQCAEFNDGKQRCAAADGTTLCRQR